MLIAPLSFTYCLIALLALTIKYGLGDSRWFEACNLLCAWTMIAAAIVDMTFVVVSVYSGTFYEFIAFFNRLYPSSYIVLILKFIIYFLSIAFIKSSRRNSIGHSLTIMVFACIYFWMRGNAGIESAIVIQLGWHTQLFFISWYDWAIISISSLLLMWLLIKMKKITNS